jgi:DNA-binding PadR family transcriptional regulator
MRGTLLLSILEQLADSAIEFGNFAEAVITSGYGASRTRIAYNQENIRRTRRQKNISVVDERRVYNLLYRLRKDGLVEENVRNGSRLIKVSPKGLEWLKKLRIRKSHALPSAVAYRPEKDQIIKIILFDIPERERARRNWLREVLKRLGFRMLQESVWIGKAKVPKELLNDLFRLKLLPYIEIIGVTKQGSLRPIV